MATALDLLLLDVLRTPGADPAAYDDPYAACVLPAPRARRGTSDDPRGNEDAPAAGAARAPPSGGGPRRRVTPPAA